MNPIIFNDYDAFIRKFTDHPRTTDECYTPREVYDTVLRFVDEHITPLDGRPVLRPFYPGGDYEHADYPPGGIVIDNPPFSIYSSIVRFYATRGIPFFLFAPALTGANHRLPESVCFVIASADITYENGAKVRTIFATNLVPGLRLWTCPTLARAIEAAQTAVRQDKRKPTVNFPYYVTSSARLLMLSDNDVEFRVPVADCHGVAKACGRDIFGGGYLLSEAKHREAEAKRREAEAKRREAEAKRAIVLDLTPEERAIIASLPRP